MELLQRVPIERLTPARLWAEIDAETRQQAAAAVYEPESEDESQRAEADQAIASTLRFRLVAVRKLPARKRIDYLTRVVRPDDGLASTLLRALHLSRRRPLLSAFLDALAVPHRDGVIETEEPIELPDRARLSAAVAGLRASFDPAEVELYLATLLAMDPELWAPLADAVRDRSG